MVNKSREERDVICTLYRTLPAVLIIWEQLEASSSRGDDGMSRSSLRALLWLRSLLAWPCGHLGIALASLVFVQ